MVIAPRNYGHIGGGNPIDEERKGGRIEIAIAISLFFRYNRIHQIYTQQLLMNNSTSGWLKTAA